jgi:hypothetical protein
MLFASQIYDEVRLFIAWILTSSIPVINFQLLNPLWKTDTSAHASYDVMDGYGVNGG